LSVWFTLSGKSFGTRGTDLLYVHRVFPGSLSAFLDCCRNARFLDVFLVLLVFLVIFLTVVALTHDCHFFSKKGACFAAKHANLISGGRHLLSMRNEEYQISEKFGQLRHVSSRLRIELFLLLCRGTVSGSVKTQGKRLHGVAVVDSLIQAGK
jgi:hypothetical protein